MNDRKKTFRRSLLLILAPLLFAGILALVLLFSRAEGAYAVVTVDGKEVGRYALGTDIDIPIESEYGSNLIRIRDGTVNVASADCKNRICVHTRAVKYNGETIVCLPHKLVVRIAGKDSPLDGTVR